MKNNIKLKQATDYIIENIAEQVTLNEIEDATGICRFTLTRMFKKKYGVSPVKWIWRLRTEFAKQLLESTLSARIIDIAVYSGFSSQAHLSRLIKETYGKTPAEIKASATKAVTFDDYLLCGSLQNAIKFVA